MSTATQIVFIHGMYLNGQSWTPWAQRAAARGFGCHTTSWPYHDGEPAALRADIDSSLGSLTFGAIASHLKAFIDGMPQRPVLIGHSIGGLLLQKLHRDAHP